MRPFLVTIADLLYQAFRGQSIHESSAYSPQKISVIVETVIVNLAVTVLIASTALVIWRSKRRWFPKAAVLLTLIELFLFSRGNLISFPLTLADEQVPARDWLADHAGYDRILSTSGNLPYTGLGVYWSNLKAREPFSPNKLTEEELIRFERFRKELAALGENQALLRRVQDAAGYAAAIPESYLKFWEESPSSPNAPGIKNLSDPRIDIAGIKYIVTGYPEDYLSVKRSDDFTLVFEEGGIRIYENTNVLPRAFLLQGEQIVPVKIIEYETTRVRMRVDANTDTKLVLTDTYYPGWVATVDEESVPVQVFEGVFRMIVVPEGIHEVEFLYRPNSIRVGAIISLAAILGVSIALLWRQRRESQSSSSTTTARPIPLIV